MAKKSVTLCCLDCDIEYTVKYSEENLKINPDLCPFCGNQVDEESSDDFEEEESDEKSDDDY